MVLWMRLWILLWTIVQVRGRRCRDFVDGVNVDARVNVCAVAKRTYVTWCHREWYNRHRITMWTYRWIIVKVTTLGRAKSRSVWSRPSGSQHGYRRETSEKLNQRGYGRFRSVTSRQHKTQRSNQRRTTQRRTSARCVLSQGGVGTE